MNRGTIGLLPRTPTLEDESYLAFMESLRNHKREILRLHDELVVLRD